MKFADPRKARAPTASWLVSWTPTPFENGHLTGHRSIAFSGGWVVHQIPVLLSNDGTVTVGTPNAANLDRDARIKLDAGGKRQYRPIITFESTSGRERWQAAVLQALRDAGIAPSQAALEGAR